MILCCGEALIDMIPSESVTGEPCFVPHAGGAVFNTAIALGRLRSDIGFVTGLSTDLFGLQLRRALAASNVDDSLIVATDLPTTLAFVQLTNGQASYTFYDENTAGRQLDAARLPTMPQNVEALFFGGISLISEPCAQFYTALALREAASNVIALDPNIRPGFIENTESYRARLETLISHADILKVSDEDLNWIVPGPQTLQAKAGHIHQLGPKVMVLTRGANGAAALLPNGEMIEVSAEPVTVVDTVGAGDAFNAGILHNLSRNKLLTKDALASIKPADMQNALAFGTRVSAVTVSRSGANPPWSDELTGKNRNA